MIIPSSSSSLSSSSLADQQMTTTSHHHFGNPSKNLETFSITIIEFTAWSWNFFAGVGCRESGFGRHTNR
ncbi:hypothetical protein CsSME_00005204 [Camellia sinensis var. sinensis]